MLTTLSRGEIRCWTANYNKKNSRETGLSTVSSSSKFALLHTFTGHAHAVTCIILHKVPGLAISCSLDSTIKILNLEYLVELYSVYLGHGVLDMRIVNINDKDSGCLFTMTDGSIKLWQITSYTEKFGVLTSPVTKIETVENIQLKSITTPPLRIDALNASNTVYPSMVHCSDSKRNESTDRAVMTRSAQDVVVYDEYGAVISRLEADQVVVNSVVHCALSIFQKRLFCLCDNDTVRVYSLRSLLSSLEKTFSVRSKSDVNLADEQTLSACLCLINIRPESDMMMARASAVDSSNGMGQSRTKRGKGPGGSLDHASEDGKEEYLLVGMRNGSILFIDCLRSCELLFNFKAFSGIITSLKYRRSQSELIIVGRNVAETSVSVKVLRLPDLSCNCESHDLNNICCYAVAECSHDFAFGCVDGNIRLFTSASMVLFSQAKTVTGEAEPCQELNYSRLHHDVEILCISFSYEPGVYATCARDSFVKIWECEKGLLRSIRLNQICYSVAFAGNVTYIVSTADSTSKKSGKVISSAGDIRISQGNYILNIPKRLWDDRQIKFGFPEAVKTSSSREVDSVAMRTAGMAALPSDGGEDALTPISTPKNSFGNNREAKISQVYGSIATSVFNGQDPNHVHVEVSLRRASQVAGDKNDRISKRSRQFTRSHLISQIQSRVTDNSPQSSLPQQDIQSETSSPHSSLRAATIPLILESEVHDRSPIFLGIDNATKRPLDFAIKDAFDFVSIRIPTLPNEASTKTSVINVRRPRFLIRKKPSIRSMPIEAVLENSVPTGQDAMAPQQQLVEKSLDQELGSEVVDGDSKLQLPQKTLPTTIRSTAIGLSPRARLTLLSVPVAVSQVQVQSASMTDALDGVDVTSAVDNREKEVNVNAVFDNMIIESSRMTISDSYKLHREYLRVGKERAYQESFRMAAGSHLTKVGAPDSSNDSGAIPRSAHKRRGNLQMKVSSTSSRDDSPAKAEMVIAKEDRLAADPVSPHSLLQTRKSALAKSYLSPRKKTVNFALMDT